MPRMQVYLPEDLYEEVKTQGLPASELLQRAVRAELRRRRAESETDRYLAELRAEVGEPSDAERARAAEVIRGLIKPRTKRPDASRPAAKRSTANPRGSKRPRAKRAG